MKFIDDTGRILGKINIIDFLVVLFILMVVSVFVVPGSPVKQLLFEEPRITLSVKLYEAEHKAIRQSCDLECKEEKERLKTELKNSPEFLKAFQAQDKLSRIMYKLPRLRKYIQ